MTTDLVVLGAGPAGLAAAWRAALAGLSVTLVERSAYVGEMTGSRLIHGICCDVGSHRLHPATPAHIIDDLKGLLGEDLQACQRNGRLRLADRWVSYPLRLAELSRTLPAGLLASITRDATTGLLRRRLPHPDTYAAVLQAGMGNTLYSTVYAPFAEKLWGIPGTQISGHQARTRVSADRPGKLLTRLLRDARQGKGRTFYYPRQGFGQIALALAEAATQAGATLRLETEIEHIQLRTDTATVTTTDGEILHARRVFSTLALPSLVRLVSPGAPARVVEAATRLRFRGVILVYLEHLGGPETPRWTPYDAHYISADDTRITRISEPTNYRDNPDDPNDRSVICVEIPVTVGDNVWQEPDARLVEQVLARLPQLDLPPVKLGEWQVLRQEQVYPIYPVGYESHLAVLDLWASQLPNLTSFGRLGLFAHDAAHHSLIEAYAAVEAFAGGEWNEGTWQRARGEFAQHVVED